MKALNIVGIIISVAIMPISAYYVESTSTARWAAWYYYEDYSSYPGPSAADVTIEGGLICILITLFFIYQNIMNLVKIKTTPSKVLAIIALSLIGLSLVIGIFMVALAGSITFDEGGQIYLFSGIIMLAFSIVYLVQTITFKKEKIGDHEIIDDII